MKRIAYTRGVRLLASCVLAAVTLGGAMGYTANRKPSVPAAAVEEAEAALAAIAAKHGTDPQTLLGAVVDHRLADRIPLKGGVAVVSESVYVLPRAAQNELGFKELKEGWKGAPRAQSELVVVAGKKVLGSVKVPDGVSLGDATIFWFQPDQVRFLDGKRFSMGNLDRTE
ncbi:hypothetical protein [Pyxidicoccus caerfyrddinensis]|uniref:hypothetical protein n=1 Tax=Pyxidicoccus caerfyrddinensis TaxID=2709663 RepID=UPI0013DC5B5B|nr:hypothetical protein [Pyxidicoccus caerfyrddinensis]